MSGQACRVTWYFSEAVTRGHEEVEESGHVPAYDSTFADALTAWLLSQR
jgi:hypothetical protein